MRKTVTMLFVCLLVLSIAGAAFAADPQLPGTDPQGVLEHKRARLDKLAEFQGEIHRINDLRIERLQLRIQVIEKHDKILDLLIEAREENNLEALKEAREVRQQIKEINREIASLHQQAAGERKAFREAVKEGNIDKARTHLNNVIDLLKKINSNIEEKIDLLDKIIEILS